MDKKLPITVDEEVYEGLYRVIGRRNISPFIESLVRPHVMGVDLDVAYGQMAQEEYREAEALEWQVLEPSAGCAAHYQCGSALP